MPHHSVVAKINDVVINRYPGEAREYNSRDQVLENEYQYPLEFINSLTPSGFPPYGTVHGKSNDNFVSGFTFSVK